MGSQIVFEKRETRTILAILLIIAAVALIGIAVAYFYYPELFAVAPPVAPAAVSAEKIVIMATPRQSDVTFPEGLVITGTILDKDMVPITTVTLTSPTWSASIEDLNLTERLYVRFTVEDMYWYFWEFENLTEINGKTYAVIPISADSPYYRSTDKAIVLQPHFVNVSDIVWDSVENRTGLGAGPSTITLTNVFNQSAHSLAYGLKLEIKCNSSVFNATSITFGGVQITLPEYNVTAEGWSVNVTLAQLLENAGSEVTSYELLVTGNWASTGANATVTYNLYMINENEVEELVATKQATLQY
ncbi:MAG: hypothetical protein ACXQS5_03370 [Candidatus Methanospirareceae archaeon]